LKLWDSPIKTTLVAAAVRPFKVIFKTDENEVTTAISISAFTSETFAGIAGAATAGIVGFSLTYWQAAC